MAFSTKIKGNHHLQGNLPWDVTSFAPACQASCPWRTAGRTASCSRWHGYFFPLCMVFPLKPGPAKGPPFWCCCLRPAKRGGTKAASFWGVFGLIIRWGVRQWLAVFAVPGAVPPTGRQECGLWAGDQRTGGAEAGGGDGESLHPLHMGSPP